MRSGWAGLPGLAELSKVGWLPRIQDFLGNSQDIAFWFHAKSPRGRNRTTSHEESKRGSREEVTIVDGVTDRSDVLPIHPKPRGHRSQPSSLVAGPHVPNPSVCPEFCSEDMGDAERTYEVLDREAPCDGGDGDLYSVLLEEPDCFPSPSTPLGVRERFAELPARSGPRTTSPFRSESQLSPSWWIGPQTRASRWIVRGDWPTARTPSHHESVCRRNQTRRSSSPE